MKDFENPAVKEACHHLLNIWNQFGSSSHEEGSLKIYCMSAPEDAAEFLYSYGLVDENNGWYTGITAKGIELMQSTEF